MKKNIVSLIIFDTETNGLTLECSVLSISAIKVFYNITTNKFLSTFESFDRYYYIKDGEAPNLGAINVNGLTTSEIQKRRDNKPYPKFFYDDISSFIDFCSTAKHFIGHNIKFDLKYIDNHMIIENTFDTMSTNRNIMKLPATYGFKNPKLSEAATFYNIDVAQYNFHSSLDDVKVTAKIFRMMCKNNNKNALDFIKK